MVYPHGTCLEVRSSNSGATVALELLLCVESELLDTGSGIYPK